MNSHPPTKTVIQKFLVGLVATLCLLFDAKIAYSEPQIEIMHWWSRGSESRAMHVLRDAFESRGGTWFDVAGNSQIPLLNTAMSRMAKGYAPTLVQWNSSLEISQIRKLGMLNSIPEDQLEALRNQFISNVLKLVMVNDELVAIPVNIHSENWLWYKPSQLPEQATNAFDTWANFLALAETNSQIDQVAMAVGDEPWQRRILFNNVLLGVAGQIVFEKIYSGLDISALEDPGFINAVNTFQELRKYSHSFGEGRWDQQVAAVAENKALTVSMGDWAKGEFRNLGLKLERDFVCKPAPGTSNNILLVMDMFALGKVSNIDEQNGQQLFLDVVTDRAVSEAFNYLKGSLSPLRLTDLSMLDKCNKIAYRVIDRPGKAIKPHADIGDRGFIADIDHLISNLWSNESDTATWTLAFKYLLEEEKSKRYPSDRIAANE